MITVSLREFQHNSKELLKKLPLTLTIYGKPVAIVDTYKESVDTSVDTMSDNSTMPIKIEGENSEKIITDSYSATFQATNIPVKSSLKENRWCELHFEKGVKYDCRKITWEDEHGNPIIKEKWACPKCIESYENKGIGRVYYL